MVCGLFCWTILRLMDYIVILGKNILDMKKFGFLIIMAAACALVACNEKPNKGETGGYTLSWDLQTVLTSGSTVDSVVMAVNGKHVQTLTDATDGIYKFEGTAEDGAVAKVSAYINHSEFVQMCWRHWRLAPLVWTTIRSVRWAHPSTTMCVAWFRRF